MRLTNYTDYSLRMLIYLGSMKKNNLASIQEIADAYQISKNHLMKVAHELGKKGYIETIRGRNGGLRLAQLPKEINVGEVVRSTEEDFNLVECFDKENNSCVISPACRLKHVLHSALTAYFEVLDQYQLADLIVNDEMLRQLFETNR
ncbi:Rrf2 family transcriptional regulator [Bacillus hwajinpoensis]|uniref:HTH-type transcriptional regulator NsrR n=1 Tax=Guptibacillus hwajinpoensis TaxID=208199 RepID=A0A845EWQ5_9BACL|nr:MULTISPECIES: Rrf2 family transcriptional regulator [Bacillaceae]MYL62980.1 Rrf2 family transcriptional regulator [Pseudalkalibacillus hwajinpoensis]PFG14017.1 BadM/Rrf2 family transcriptional regulator [Bacillus sp. es.036]